MKKMRKSTPEFLDVVKTTNVDGKAVTIIYYPTIRGYEVRVSRLDKIEILHSEGYFTRKSDAIRVWKEVVDEEGRNVRRKIAKVV